MSQTILLRRFPRVGALLISSVLCGCASLIGLEDADPLGVGGASAASSSATDGSSSTGIGGGGGADPEHFLPLSAQVRFRQLAVLEEDKSVLVLGAVEKEVDVEPMCGDLDLEPLDVPSAPILRVALEEEVDGTFVRHGCTVHRSLRGEDFSVTSMVTNRDPGEGLPALGLGGTYGAPISDEDGEALIDAEQDAPGAFALSLPLESQTSRFAVGAVDGAVDGAAPLGGFGIPQDRALSFAWNYGQAAPPTGIVDFECSVNVQGGELLVARSGAKAAGACLVDREFGGRVIDAAPGAGVVAGLTAAPVFETQGSERLRATVALGAEPAQSNLGTRRAGTNDRDSRVRFVPIPDAEYFLVATTVETAEGCASDGPFVARFPVDGSSCDSWDLPSTYARLIAGVGVRDEIAVAIGKIRSEETDDFDLQHLRVVDGELEPYPGDEAPRPFCTSCDVRDMAISREEVWILGVAIQEGDAPTVMGHDVPPGPFLYHAQFEELFR